jgi:tetrahydromethanopterin S-methyltransferase subunit D
MEDWQRTGYRQRWRGPKWVRRPVAVLLFLVAALLVALIVTLIVSPVEL